MEHPYKEPYFENNKLLYREEILHINEKNLLETLQKNGDVLLTDGPLEIIEKLFEQHASDMNLGRYLNNFHVRIGMALIWSPSEIKEIEEIPEELMNSEIFKLKYSKKRKEQTVGEFFEEIQQTIEECGIAKDTLTQSYKEYIETEDQEERTQNNRKFYQQIRKIYIALRKKWYNHFELMQ